MLMQKEISLVQITSRCMTHTRLSEQRRALKKPGKWPRTGEQVLHIVHQFLTVRSRTASKEWSHNGINKCVDGLRSTCQSVIQWHAGGLATARDWVSFIWTTTDLTSRILQCSGAQREFCFIVKEAYARDIFEKVLIGAPKLLP